MTGGRALIAAALIALSGGVGSAGLRQAHRGVPTSTERPCAQLAIVGDSLTAQGQEALHDTFPGAIINARGGRTVAEAYEAASGIRESNTVDCWVFALGTNDVFRGIDPTESEDAVARLLTFVGSAARVWWIVPHFAHGMDGSTFSSVIPSFVPVVDLPILPDDFAPDGIHLTDDGYERRADQIAALVS